ncbi:MAG: Thiol:disulfide interchange protein DsbD [bacterium]|nr:Thiol:disulfide interchange protein DsbD [bacterium]
MRFRPGILAILTLVALLASSTVALAAPQRVGPLEVDLITPQQSVMPGQPLTVGLQFRLDPHWHVYWRNPGDSGLSPSLGWSLPEGFSAGELQWPYPISIPLGPLVSLGYEDEVILPVTIQVPETLPTDGTVTLAARADWLVCKEECIPGDASLILTLPVRADAPTLDAALAEKFEHFRNRLPVSDLGWQVGVTSTPEKIQLFLAPPEGLTTTLKKVTFFPFESEVIEYLEPQVLQPVAGGYQLELTRSQFADGSDVTSLEGIVVSPEGWRGPGSEAAMTIAATAGKPAALTGAGGGTTTTSQGSTGSGAGNGNATTLWQALLFAFIGGMILNLMPCVLPVLSLKVFGFVKHAGQDRKQSLLHGLVFTAGVLLSFLALAVVLLVLRAGGEQVGLGFHLQSPGFLIGLSAFLFLFAMSLLGVFEIGASLTGLGSAAQAAHGLSGSFLNGVTATVVATPCTAPFMGTALGFALTQPAVGILAIFCAIGLGMSAPYVALSANPGWLKFIPKPGPWMDTFKQVMGFLLLATIAWLASVLGQVAGSAGMTALLWTLLFLGFGSWILQHFAPVTAPARTQRNAQVAALVCIVGGLLLGLSAVGNSASVSRPALAKEAESAHGVVWESFSQDRLDALVATGEQPIFIDFTAAWCLSCQVNKKVALETTAVSEKFAELGVVTIRADWTRRDAEITRALAGYQRNSVPVYVLIPPGGEPRLLPEILTPSIVLEALETLAGPPPG